MAINRTLAIRHAELSALGTLCDGGTIKLYDGVRPANSDTALSGQNLVVILTFGSPAFISPPVAGVMTANAIGSARSTYAPMATVTWGRVYEAGGATTVMDFDCGTVGTDMILDNNVIVFNTTVACTSMTISELA